MTNQNTNYSIRFNKTFSIATVSKEFKEQMYVYGSEAFEMAREIREAYPNITFRVASNYTQKTKKVTYEAMKNHLKAKIAVAEGDEKKELEKALAKFDAIKALSQIEHNPYRYVLAWFESVCSEKAEKVEECAETAQSQEDQQALTIADLVAA